MCYREARSVPGTGDLIDVFSSAGKQANVVFADTCGGDARAQADGRYLRHVVRMLADKRSPGSLVECVNAAFHHHLIGGDGEDRFARLFVATLQQRRLTYASAGLEFAWLLSANGQYRRLPPTGVILGINDAHRYKEGTLAVAPEDWLILVTGGVTDARDARGRAFGTSRVVRNAISAIVAGFDDPAAWILEASRTHGRVRYVDNASVLCVRFS